MCKELVLYRTPKSPVNPYHHPPIEGCGLKILIMGDGGGETQRLGLPRWGNISMGKVVPLTHSRFFFWIVRHTLPNNGNSEKASVRWVFRPGRRMAPKCRYDRKLVKNPKLLPQGEFEGRKHVEREEGVQKAHIIRDPTEPKYKRYLN